MSPKEGEIKFSLRTVKSLLPIGCIAILLVLPIPLTTCTRQVHSDLIQAAKKGDIDSVEASLGAGADVNAKNRLGQTALMLAARNAHTKIVRALLDNGAEVNAEDGDGHTALIYAAGHGDIEVIQTLLAEGADVNVKGKDGDTAFRTAVRSGRTEVVRLLKDAGAKDERASDNGGEVRAAIPRWPFIAFLSIVAFGVLACLIPLAQRRERLGGVLLAPGRTLQDVAKQPDWVAPFFLVLASALLGALAASGSFLTSMGSRPPGLPIFMMVMPLFFMVVVATIFGYGAWFVRTGSIWLLARISGERTRFYPLLSAVGYAYLPVLLQATVAAGMLAFGVAQISGLSITMPTSLAGLFPALAAGKAPLRVLLGEIEIFSLWSLVLMVIGVQRVYGFRMRQAAAIGAIYWILVVGATVGVAALWQGG